jgi:ABC-type amino acid transport substrate-binding protein
MKLIAALLVVVALPAAALDLRVCLLSHNLPYSARDTDNGFDVDVARAVASVLKREFVPIWIENPTTLQEIDESDIPTQRLAHGGCDAIFSVPGPARDSLKGSPTLALGVPYYGAAFELIGPPTIPGYLKALREKPVAIQAQTIASFALAILQAKQRTYFSVSSALAGVTAGDAYAALLWGPAASWYLQQHPALKLAIPKGYEPPAALRWNLCVATRSDEQALRAAIDTALAELRASAKLDRIAADYGWRLHPIFTTTYSLTEINKLR